jgi:hypothetical protein
MLEKRILENICKKWRIFLGDLLKIIIIRHKVPNLTLGYNNKFLNIPACKNYYF